MCFYQKHKKDILSIITIIFSSFFCGVIFFFGYKTTYNSSLYYNREAFERLFSSKIFKFRILARELFLFFDKKFINASDYPFIKNAIRNLYSFDFLYKNPDYFDFYFSNFVFITFFSSVFGLLVYYLLKNKNFDVKDKQPLFISLGLIVSFWLLNFAITPYDVVSNCLFVISVMVILSDMKNFVVKNIVLVFLMVAATLTREASLFIFIFYASLYFAKYRFSMKNKEAISLVLVLLSFVVSYFSLRFYLGFENGYCQNCVADFWFLMKKFSSIIPRVSILFFDLQSLISLSFFVFAICFLSQFRKNKEHYIFLVLSLFYVYLILFIGILWELRLWYPILMGYLIFSLIKQDYFFYKSNKEQSK